MMIRRRWKKMEISCWKKMKRMKLDPLRPLFYFLSFFLFFLFLFFLSLEGIFSLLQTLEIFCLTQHSRIFFRSLPLLLYSLISSFSLLFLVFTHRKETQEWRKKFIRNPFLYSLKQKQTGREKAREKERKREEKER